MSAPWKIMVVNQCDIVTYNKKYIFGLSPLSWHRAPKAIGISCDESDKSVFCYVNDVVFGGPPE